MATIRPNDIGLSTTPTLSSKALPSPIPAPSKLEKRSIAPRIDIEPLYTTLKSSIPDTQWPVYKTTISQFLLGNFNQAELSQQLDRILTTSALEHAHNQFVLAVLANAMRDAPESGNVVGFSWADDKVVGGGKVAGGKGGDGMGEVEKRLKFEVMQLSRRERKRLKTGDAGGRSDGGGAGTGAAGGRPDYGYEDPYTEMMREMLDAKRIKAPDTGPASAGGFQKTNWDLEIRKHYSQPLFTETHEFPDTNTIASRMLPICYENGLPSGHTADCAPFMNTATETYIKEALANFFQRVSSNGHGYIRTAEYRKKVDREERKVARGELQRGKEGLLPVEVEEMRKRRPLEMEDLRLCLSVGDPFLGIVPVVAGNIVEGIFLDSKGAEDVWMESRVAMSDPVSDSASRPALPNGTGVRKPMVNGTANVTANGGTIAGQMSATAKTKATPVHGWTVEFDEPAPGSVFPLMDEEMGLPGAWSGGAVEDALGLDGVLDGCLAVGT